MIEIVSVILAEYETIPFALLEVLFARIIDPEKVFTQYFFIRLFDRIRKSVVFMIHIY